MHPACLVGEVASQSWFIMDMSIRIPGNWSVLHLHPRSVPESQPLLFQGLAVDHTTDLLYAAGQDCRIRGWSLSTGEPVISSCSPPGPVPASAASSPIFSASSSVSSRVGPFTTSRTNSAPSTANVNRQTILSTPQDPWSHTHPFSTTFAEPIPVLRVSPDEDGRGGRGGGRCLWAAGGEGLWRWNLGHRAIGGGGLVWSQ